MVGHKVLLLLLGISVVDVVCSLTTQISDLSGANQLLSSPVKRPVRRPAGSGPQPVDCCIVTLYLLQELGLLSKKAVFCISLIKNANYCWDLINWHRCSSFFLCFFFYP